MTRDDFMKIVPAPGFALLELVTPYDPCESYTDQPSKIVKLDPVYRGPLERGMTVVLADKCPDAKFCWSDGGAPGALVPINSIVGVVK